MSDARIAQLRDEIEHQVQRAKDFSEYPEAVEAAKRAEQAAKDELHKLTGETAAPKKQAKSKTAAANGEEG